MGLAGASLVEARQLRPGRRFADRPEGPPGRAVGCPAGPGGPAHDRAAAARRPRAASASCWPAPRDRPPAAWRSLGGRIERLEDLARRGEDLAERLHHEVISSRLRPLIDGVRGFPRMVRDVARQLGKRVRFEIVGEQTGVDRDILERLEAPLNHLIRNALDHGIETPDGPPNRRQGPDGHDPPGGPPRRRDAPDHPQRRRPGDRPRATIRRRVVDRGMADATMAERLLEAELLEFLFLPGFTTRGQVDRALGPGRGARRGAEHGAVGGRLGAGHAPTPVGAPPSACNCRSRCR